MDSTNILLGVTVFFLSAIGTLLAWIFNRLIRQLDKQGLVLDGLVKRLDQHEVYHMLTNDTVGQMMLRVAKELKEER